MNSGCLLGNKRRKQWIWLALNRETREIFGMAVGSRMKTTARKLWASLPGVYRECAVCSTDVWEAYAAVLPSKPHRPVGKERGQTNHIERFNNTLRQRCSRLVRKPSRSRKNWRTRLVRSGTLSTTLTRSNAQNAVSLPLHDYRDALPQPLFLPVANLVRQGVVLSSYP